MAHQCEIFISYAKEDVALATAIESLISDAFGVQVYRFQHMTPGVDWRDNIAAACRASKATLILLTPESIRSQWVLFEAGLACASKHDVFPLCALGVAEGAEYPINNRQAVDLRKEERITALLIELQRVLGAGALKENVALRKKVIELAKEGAVEGWDKVSDCLKCDRPFESPFSLDRVLAQARRLVFIGGPDLYSLTSDERENGRRYAEWIFSFLPTAESPAPEKQSRKVWLLVSQEPWEDLFGEEARAHWRHSIRVLKSWQKRAERELAGGSLEIRAIPLVRISTVFVDPNEPNGLMTLTPIIYESKPANRTHFILRKSHELISFESYWTQTARLFMEPHLSKRIEKVDENGP